MTLSNVNKAHYAGGVVLPGLISGGPALGPAGLAETAGVIDRGRELWDQADAAADEVREIGAGSASSAAGGFR